ncbi:hypothetical protein IAR50_004923 [Cryptococcus sp. DSM 104548]
MPPEMFDSKEGPGTLANGVGTGHEGQGAAPADDDDDDEADVGKMDEDESRGRFESSHSDDGAAGSTMQAFHDILLEKKDQVMHESG